MKKNTDILNKLRLETDNTNAIHLWLEGMFWKAYERSAYLFVHRISGYKPYKKFVRAVGGEVVAIGFPTKSIDKLLDGRSVEHIDEKHYILNGFTVDTRELREFQTWKKSIPSFPYQVVESSDYIGRGDTLLSVENGDKQPPVKETSLTSSSESLVCPPEISGLIEEIRRFRMESATPLDCMMFLAQLIKQSLEIKLTGS